MGKINQGILDGFNGKVGTVVGYKVNGKKVMRAYVDKIRNPRTSLQMDNRLRFKTLAQLASAFLSATTIGLECVAKSLRHTVSNSFMRVNQAAVSATGGEAEVDYGSLTCSLGGMPQVAFGNASFAEPQRVGVTFSPDADMSRTDAQDKVYLLVYQPDTNQGLLSAPVLRTTGTLTLRLPASWTGMTVHVYGFAVGDGRNNLGLRSDSSYVGTGNVG